MAEDDPFYDSKNELNQFGLSEYLLLWPTDICPLVWLTITGIGTLTR